MTLYYMSTSHLCPYSQLYVPPFPQGTHSLMQNPHRTTLIAPHTHFFGSLRVCVCVGLETISAATSTLFFSFVVFFCKHKKLNLHN